MTTLYLIRHAESEMNFSFPHLIGGRSNHSPLTQVGRQQSHRLGLRFKNEKIIFDRYIVSPAIRTKDTFQLTMAAMGLEVEPIIDERIQELHQGDWEGQPRAEIYPPVQHDIQRLKWHFKAPKGESQYEVEQRMTAFADSCHAMFPNKRLGVFTHGMSIKCLLRSIEGWPPETTYNRELDNTAISIIQYQDGRWHSRRINDKTHLLTA